jgi:hypothetical protein
MFTMTTKELALTTVEAMTYDNWTRGAHFRDTNGQPCEPDAAVRACAYGRAYLIGGRESAERLFDAFLKHTCGLTAVNDQDGLAGVKKALRKFATDSKA